MKLSSVVVASTVAALGIKAVVAGSRATRRRRLEAADIGELRVADGSHDLTHLAKLQLDGIDQDRVAREAAVLAVARKVLRAVDDAEAGIILALCLMGAHSTGESLDEFMPDDSFSSLVEALHNTPNLDLELES